MTAGMGPRSTPEWVAGADRSLARAFKSVALLGHLGPTNFGAEVERLTGIFQRGGADRPAFTYGRPADLDGLRVELDALARALEAEGELGRVYAERARELALEARMVERRGTSELAVLAAERYRAGVDVTGADALADALLRSAHAEDEAVADIVSDDPSDPRSLLSRLRAELGRRHLAARVVVAPSLAALAAVGDGVVQISPGRRLRARDVERTVLHEVEGHLEPGRRARAAPLGIFAFGTARGSDEQEGYALLAERRAGHLAGVRGRELAARHRAARAAHTGVAFEEVVAELVGEGVEVPVAVRSACRAFRGGGLGREAAYLVSLVRVEQALAADPGIEAILASGRVATTAAATLAPWVVLDPSPIRPRAR